MVEDVVKPMVDEGQPKEKLQVPYYYGWNGRGLKESKQCLGGE